MPNSFAWKVNWLIGKVWNVQHNGLLHIQQAVEARREYGREVRVLHWQQYKEQNSMLFWRRDIFMVGKAWDKLMVQHVNYAAKIYVQKRHVSSAAHCSSFSLIKMMFCIFQMQECAWIFFFIFKVFRLFLLTQYLF